MAGPGGCAAADRIHSQLLRQLPKLTKTLIGHGDLLPGDHP